MIKMNFKEYFQLKFGYLVFNVIKVKFIVYVYCVK